MFNKLLSFLGFKQKEKATPSIEEFIDSEPLPNRKARSKNKTNYQDDWEGYEERLEFEKRLDKVKDPSLRIEMEEDFYRQRMMEKLELENDVHVSPEYEAEYYDFEEWLYSNFEAVKPYDAPPYDDLGEVKNFISGFKFIGVKDSEHLKNQTRSDLIQLYTERSGYSKEKVTELLEDVLTVKFVYGE